MSKRHIARAWRPLLVAGILLGLALGLLPRAAGAAPITLDGSSDEHPLIEHLDALLDPGGALRVEQAASREMRPIQRLRTGVGRWPGEPQPVVWMRFELRVPDGAARRDWCLVVGRPYNPGTVYVEEGGGFRAFPMRLEPSGGSFRLPLPLTAGTRRVLLRVPGPVTRPSLLLVTTPARLDRIELRLLTGQGLYLGVVLAMALVNALLGVALRDRAHLWYVAFIASSAAAFSFLTGTVSRLALPGAPAHALFRPQLACIALLAVTGVQFGRLLLDTPRAAPRTDRVMTAYLGLSMVTLCLLCAGPDLLALRAVALLGVLVPFVAISAGVACWRAKAPLARFYLLGWSLFTVGGFLFATPLLPRGVDALPAFQLASALEVALFALALVDRLRVLRHERAQAEQRLKHAEQKVLQAEKLAALGRLVAGVAHEVNNPNNFLTFNLPVLQEYLDALRPHVEAARERDGDLRLFGLTVEEFFADAATLVGNMQHGAERIAGIVAQLRSYVRQDDEAQWEEADVNRVVRDAATLARTALQRLGSRFEARYAPGLPPVRMNPGRVEQVVINLLLNAAQAAGRRPGGRVEVRTLREGDHVLIAVEDDGPGVPEHLRERIFEPFFTTRSGEQGMGMGLAISQRIVDEHGGTLELASASEGRTCFVVRLPIPAERT